MQYTSVERVYFSATGTTKIIVEAIGKEFTGEQHVHDLVRCPPDRELALASTCLTIVGVPVFAGRIPVPAAQRLARFKGSNTPAVAVVVYGNRDYDDALLELKNILEGNGFVLMGAGAFIARHSIFPNVAADRPDAKDCARIAEFARQCAHKLHNLSDCAQAPAFSVKGNEPYKEIKPAMLQPTVNEACTRCGACVDVCPTGALSLDAKPDTGLVKESTRCIACAACIAVCPTGAQAFRGSTYEAFAKVFGEKCAARREPEVFV